MTQLDIINFLKSNPENWYTADDIRKILKLNVNLHYQFRRLRSFQMVEFKRIKLKIGCSSSYVYRYKE